MGIGHIIIGDEILSGKRADKHLAKLIELLSMRGMQLGWAEYIGDEPARIIATLKRTFGSDDIVFCCGGIGATPDDHTRQCAAAALGVPLVLHPEAKKKIEERMMDMAREAGQAPQLQAPENLHRLKMGEFPQGATIIHNPSMKIPGFSVSHGQGAHFFVHPRLGSSFFCAVLSGNVRADDRMCSRLSLSSFISSDCLEGGGGGRI